MIQLIFIRHGATAGNLEKRYIGRTDEALCDVGIAQVEALKKRCFGIDWLFVSPLLRTQQTAELLFPQTPYTIVCDFSETDFGLFEGKTAAELSGCPEYREWVESGCIAPIPQGESVAAFKARCCSAFSEIIQTIPEEATAAFVLHGGVIMSILEKYGRPQRGFYEWHVCNGEYIVCVYQEGIISLR